MSKIFFIILFLFGCSSLHTDERDQISRILELKKLNDPDKITKLLGKPERVESTDPRFDAYYIPRKGKDMPVKVFVDRQARSIDTIALTFWVDFDAYAYLKQRFKSHHWIEKSVPSSAIDVVEELYKVDIPQLGVSFQYNDQDPLRRPMWIFFK